MHRRVAPERPWAGEAGGRSDEEVKPETDPAPGASAGASTVNDGAVARGDGEAAKGRSAGDGEAAKGGSASAGKAAPDAAKAPPSPPSPSYKFLEHYGKGQWSKADVAKMRRTLPGAPLEPLDQPPAPRTVESYTGTIVRNERDADVPTVEPSEVSYVPVAVAREQLERVVRDLHATRARHLSAIRDLDRSYRTVEEETRAHYTAFIEDLKARARQRLGYHKRLYAEAVARARADREAAAAHIASLEESLREEREGRAADLEAARAREERLTKEHEEEEESLRLSHKAEVARMQAAARDREKAQRAEAHAQRQADAQGTLALAAGLGRRIAAQRAEAHAQRQAEARTWLQERAAEAAAAQRAAAAAAAGSSREQGLKERIASLEAAQVEASRRVEAVAAASVAAEAAGMAAEDWGAHLLRGAAVEKRRAVEHVGSQTEGEEEEEEVKEPEARRLEAATLQTQAAAGAAAASAEGDEGQRVREELESRLQEAEGERKAALAEVEEANKAKEEANKAKEEANKAKEEAEAEVEEAKKAKEEANKAKEEAEAKVEEAKKAKEEAEVEVRTLSSARESAAAELGSLRERMAAREEGGASAEMEALEKELASVRQELTEARDSHAKEAEALRSEARDAAAASQHAESASQERVSALTARTESLEKELAEARREGDKQAALAASLREQLSDSGGAAAVVVGKGEEKEEEEQKAEEMGAREEEEEEEEEEDEGALTVDQLTEEQLGRLLEGDAARKWASLAEQRTSLEKAFTEAGEEYKTAVEDKKESKEAIKKWIAEFEAREGREPGKADKQGVRQLYVRHKDLDNKVKSSKSRVEKLTEQMQGVVDARSPLLERARAQAEALAERGELAAALRATAEPTAAGAGEAAGSTKAEQEAAEAGGEEEEEERDQARVDSAEGATAAAVAAQSDAVRRAEAAEAAQKEAQRRAEAAEAEVAQLQAQLAARESGDSQAEVAALEKSLATAKEAAEAAEERAKAAEAARSEQEKEAASARQAAKAATAERDKAQTRAASTQRAGAVRGRRPAGGGRGGGSAAGGADAASLREAKSRADKAESEAADAKKSLASAREAASKAQAQAKADAAKAKQSEKALKEAKVKIKQLENAAEKAKAQAGSQDEAEKERRKAERRVAEMEKKAKKEAEEKEKAHSRAVASLEKELKQAKKEGEETKEELQSTTEERNALRKEVKELKSLTSELDSLRESAEEAKRLKKEAADLTARNEELEGLYKKEQVLRKKYWNMMEDMKGKIRVYCRCRPMAGYEEEKGCKQVVSFPDDMSLDVETSRGVKTFNYDCVFEPGSSQDQVFTEVENLVQSALDGFNVCIFAYGQTGSGKTYTMTGPPDNPGITRRAIRRLYDLIEERASVTEVKVSCYMVELYCDTLIDLFHRMDTKGRGDSPRLDIKKDSKGLVFVKNSVIKEASSSDELHDLFATGNEMRHVGSTKMNAESSRSHCVFSVIVSAFDKQTRKTSTGKLSFIDLAGSERAGKTGASTERLKEAQNINKSLSALGDVISALSSGEKFIPYRNNKLTLLMSDSLGGNAKTLMFVNISPADYNADETQTSLMYASRVKLIKNTAAKAQDSEEVTRLKKMVADLKAGREVEAEELDVT